MKFKKINFYNYFHNGDVFLGKGFVKKMINHFNIPCYYFHGNNKNLILDIKAETLDIKNIPSKGGGLMSPSLWKEGDRISVKLWFISDDALWVNTWYGMGAKKYWKGTNYQTLYNIFSSECKRMELDLFQEKMNFDYLPEIDFSYYKTNKIDEFMKKNKNKKLIYVSNGKILSGQSAIPLKRIEDITINLAKTFKNSIIISSNNSKISKGNIIYSKEIIGLENFDLIENAYLCQHCDFVIGRNSSPQTICYNKNILKTKTKVIDLCGDSFGLSKYFKDKFLTISQDQLIGFIKKCI